MMKEEKTYKQTLNLPKTDFPMKASLNQMEPKILAEWEKVNVQGALQKKGEGKKTFILHDGPPYANGDIHMGHALNKILKDMIVKYKTMRGFKAPYVPGWDCHGMPIEHALFEKLGKKKQEIDRIEFREKAKEFAMQFVERQRGQFKRLGIFGEWTEPYLTLHPTYEARIIRVFKELYLKKYIYRRKKPVYWCPTCETALAEAEIEYEERKDTAIYVKFPFKEGTEKSGVLDERNSFILIWTTTPWTLPANRALCLHPEEIYAVVRIKEKETWIVLEARLSDLTTKLGLKTDEVHIGQRIKGSELKGKVCQNPLRLGSLSKKPVHLEDSHCVTHDSVATNEGTGIVHIAPGHGEIDYHIGIENQLEVFSPVNEKGQFTEEVQIEGLSGENVFRANPSIVERLQESGSLVHEEEVLHSYPHCWRCKKPIIFRATEQWFLNIEEKDLRKRLIDAIETVRWIPSFGKNRMQGMLEVRPDWCLSRQRYWGTPIPILYCKKCLTPIEERAFFEKVEEIFEKEGSNAWFKHPAEDFLPKGVQCRCGGNRFKKEEDILDVWFDSGVSYEAVLKTNEKLSFPATLYLEGSDQHRGWFQVSLIPSVANEGKPPYEQVLTHGFVMDGEGMKMSKSRGNVVSPQEVIQKFGADILRLWVFSIQYGEDVRISDEILQRTADAYRKIRNTFKYLLGNLHDFKKEDLLEVESLLEVDRWALSRLARLTEGVTEAMEQFAFHKAYQMLYRFCVTEMSSFYLDILKDRLYTFSPSSQERRSGQTALYHILDYLQHLLAPILSFTAEEVRKSYGEKTTSIHEGTWPQAPSTWRDPDLEKRWDLFLVLREGVLKAIEDFRMAGKCGSSMETAVQITLQRGGAYDWLEAYRETLTMLLIVSDVTLGKAPQLPTGAIPILEGVGIQIQRADGKKCQRCWNWRQTVGDSTEYPDLCDRCVQVMNVLTPKQTE